MIENPGNNKEGNPLGKENLPKSDEDERRNVQPLFSASDSSRKRHPPLDLPKSHIEVRLNSK